MIVEFKDLSKDELTEMLRKAIAQVLKLVDEKQKLEQELREIKATVVAKGDINSGAKAK